jgi:hypothetical protein
MDERDTNTFLTEDATDDFYCPTFVDVAKGSRWCHYYRNKRQGWHTIYVAIIPPFRISYTENRELTVSIINFQNVITGLAIFDKIYEHPDEPTFDNFIKLYYRFKDLRVFI